MPKVQKLRKYKLASQSASPYSLPNDTENGDFQTNQTNDEGTTNTENNTTNNKKPTLSRGQRKRQEKRERVLTKLGVVPLKGMKMGQEQTKATKQKPFQALLSELEATLPTNTEVIRPAAISLKSNKMKKSIAIRESQRMKLVEQHPNFIADPLQAMRSHIEHMIALKMENKTKK